MLYVHWQIKAHKLKIFPLFPLLSWIKNFLAQKTILMISHDIAAIQQASHRMIFLEERIRYDGAADCFPDLADLATLRGIEPVHESNTSENRLYQLENMDGK